MATVMMNVMMSMSGKKKSKIRENHQPLKKAKKRPEMHIASDS